MKKIFLLGDSVCLHYEPHLRDYLKDAYVVLTKEGRDEALKSINLPVGANGGDSSHVLEYVKMLEKENKLDFDIFLFNCGLHDVKRVIPEEKLQISLEDYENNLKKIFEIMESHGIKCIFMTTTPIYEEAHNEQIPNGIKRYDEDIRRYNKIAQGVSEKYGANVIDLYDFTSRIPEAHLDYAHFNFLSRKLQAAFIAGCILGME